jgi:hypothetical protein
MSIGQRRTGERGAPRLTYTGVGPAAVAADQIRVDRCIQPMGVMTWTVDRSTRQPVTSASRLSRPIYPETVAADDDIARGE